MDKPEGWDETLEDLIRAKFNYVNANLALKKKYGDIGALDGSVYRERKNKLMGGEKVDEKLDEIGEQQRGKKGKPKAKPLVWSKGKQQAADTSKLAQIINMGIYQGMFPFCANHELKEDHVQEINPGGAIVANINYFFPESKLDHPLVLLGIRVVILYIKFKSVCGRIQKAAGEVSHVGKSGPTQGLKPGMMTERRK